MPELIEDFTPHPEEPSLPRKTRDEIVAQRLIRCAAGKLRQIAMILRGVRYSLPEIYSAEEAEAMGENRAPQSLTFSLIGSLECLLSDDIEPGIALALHCRTMGEFFMKAADEVCERLEIEE